MSINRKVHSVLKAYVALSGQDRIEFIKEINRIEKMPRAVKKDHENMINSLTA